MINNCSGFELRASNSARVSTCALKEGAGCSATWAKAASGSRAPKAKVVHRFMVFTVEKQRGSAPPRNLGRSQYQVSRSEATTRSRAERRSALGQRMLRCALAERAVEREHFLDGIHGGFGAALFAHDDLHG